jgi:plasmid maintenance system antidote protein VapI
MKNLKLKLVILKKFDTQANFAMKIHCHESFVSQVIAGRRKISNDQARLWLRALNCKPYLINSVTKL